MVAGLQPKRTDGKAAIRSYAPATSSAAYTPAGPRAVCSSVSGIATFEPGDTSKTDPVPIGNDYIYTGREEALFRLDSVDASGIIVFPFHRQHRCAGRRAGADDLQVADSVGRRRRQRHGDCVMTVTLSGQVASADIGFYQPATTATMMSFTSAVYPDGTSPRRRPPARSTSRSTAIRRTWHPRAAGAAQGDGADQGGVPQSSLWRAWTSRK